MKRILLVLVSLIMALAIWGCSSKADSAAQPAKVSTEAVKPNGKTLVVYYSLPMTYDPAKMTEKEADNSAVIKDGKVYGNTEYFANIIKEASGADIFRIETVKIYSDDYQTLIADAKEEQRVNARPEMKANVPDLSQYDTIFVGYPNWWGDMPMVLYTFFEANDFSGKTIIPFNTHGGSGFSDTINSIQKLEPNAKVVKDGLSISRNDINDAAPQIQNWIKSLGFGK